MKIHDEDEGLSLLLSPVKRKKNSGALVGGVGRELSAGDLTSDLLFQVSNHLHSHM